MSQTYEFYDARAKEAAADAGKAVLENVRERCLRAEKTWRGLAEQARRVSEQRVKSEHERQVRRDEEMAATADTLAES